MLHQSSLNPTVGERISSIFENLELAESSVHNVAVPEVHFHEVGAIDSIIDIVGSAICFTALGVEKVYVNTIELGSGMVRCEHGLLPVPAPATAKIIRNIC